MTRNHFSKHGGPYFINDGVSNHLDIDANDIKPGIFPFLSITLAACIILTVLYSLFIIF
jgi:hypothetical protein